MKLWKCRITLGKKNKFDAEQTITIFVEAESHKQVIRRIMDEEKRQRNKTYFYETAGSFFHYQLKEYGIEKINSVKSVNRDEYSHIQPHI